MAQCQAIVLKKGEIRLRRGYGFYRSYRKAQCKRNAVCNGLCAQHAKMPEWKVDRGYK